MNRFKASRFPLLVTGLLACGDSTGASLTEPVSLTLVPSTATLDAVGATVALDATVRDALGGTVAGGTIDYQSTDENVATVSSTGLVTAVGAGTTTIAASLDDLTRESAITVQQLVAESEIISGDGQSALVNTALPQPFVLEARDPLDQPIPGVDVSFALGSGPGSLSATTVTTGSDGRASTTMTLDTIAGGVYAVIATVTTGRAVPVTFRATGIADAASLLGVHRGDQQSEPVSAELPQDVIVLVTDQYGNSVAGVMVNFNVTGGGGSVNPSIATSDTSGQASAAWTLGTTVGNQTLDATAPGVGVGTVSFSATGTNLAISSISPTTLSDGAAATVTGTGFDPDPANNVVTVDGRVALVTAASSTTIDFIVPPAACVPAQPLGVAVSNLTGGTTAPTPHPWIPAAPVALAVGDQLIIQDPDDFCFQFLATVPDEQYLVGIQSVSEVEISNQIGRLIAETPPGTPAPPRAPRPPVATRRVATTLADARTLRWQAHRRAEADRQVRELAWFPNGIRTAPGARRALRSAAAIDSTVQIGQTVPIKMPRIDGDLCMDFDNLNVVVKAVGDHGIFLHDPANPPGYTDQDYLDLSDKLDNGIYDPNVNYFGQPSDLDGNNRILIVVTKNINEQSSTTLGFVNTADFETGGVCAASNQAEVYYGRAPDATGGAGGFVYPRAAALEDAPPLIAHEFTHIIQVGRRVVINQVPFMTFFMAEGQATLAEEVVGHAILGNTTGQNYGYATALNDPQNADEFWYAVAMTDIASYFGFQTLSPTVSIAGAPARCGWIRRDPSPCAGRPLWYGVTWSWLRWMGDQFGSSFAGGEAEMHRQLVDNSLRGFANVGQVVGIPFDSLLAQWAAALYVDDRIPGAAPALTMPSWDYVDIFDVGLPSSASLVPGTISYGTQDGSFTVAAGSTAYFILAGANRPDIAFRMVDAAGQPLPATMQVFLVRIQ